MPEKTVKKNEPVKDEKKTEKKASVKTVTSKAATKSVTGKTATKSVTGKAATKSVTGKAATKSVTEKVTEKTTAKKPAVKKTTPAKAKNTTKTKTTTKKKAPAKVIEIKDLSSPAESFELVRVEKKELSVPQTKELTEVMVEEPKKKTPETEGATEILRLEEKPEVLKIEEKDLQPETKKEKVEKAPKLSKDDLVFQERFNRHKDELRWLYMELYGNADMFAELEGQLKVFYDERKRSLKNSDLKREENPNWYKSNDMLGMMLYIDNFGGNLKGVQEKLDYIQKSNVNYIHLMPFLDTTEGKSDGGYAVSDFRKVQPSLGTMKDLENLTGKCHDKDINVCCDFVMNHTSDEHEWAKKARTGDGEYMSRYFFFDNDYIPGEYEKTVPQVFPATAPGNFTWVPEVNHHVMTSFYPYQWDLNYKNPRVFNEMMYNFLFLANKGIDIIRLDAVPYIWKELGTTCRNLPKVHTLVRMMRMVSEIVCPGVLLLGEVVMEPSKVVPYFGSVEKPECHMLYNVTTMATTWHTVATRNVKLLKNQLDIIDNLPKDYVFLNYLRCHDDIGWGLDYGFLMQDGIGEVSHKRYLNDFFLGISGGSNSRGELYNYDPVTQDARFCGTTASLCGIEKAGFEQNEGEMVKAINLDVMLHAYMFMQSGIPIIYSGDEIGQVNDYSYKSDPHKWADSRYIHRGKMNWENAKKIDDAKTVEGKIYQRLLKLEEIRKTHDAFVTNADAWTVETYEPAVLCMGRYYNGEKIYGIFNFSEVDKTAWVNEEDGMYEDLITGKKMLMKGVQVPAYGFYWLRKI